MLGSLLLTAAIAGQCAGGSCAIPQGPISGALQGFGRGLANAFSPRYSYAFPEYAPATTFAYQSYRVAPALAYSIAPAASYSIASPESAEPVAWYRTYYHGLTFPVLGRREADGQIYWDRTWPENRESYWRAVRALEEPQEPPLRLTRKPAVKRAVIVSEVELIPRAEVVTE